MKVAIYARADYEGQLALLCHDIPTTELAYIAGLFDGEGWIRARVKQRKDRAHGLILQIGISNTDKDCLEYVKSVLCVGKVQTNMKKVNGHPYLNAHPERWKQSYQWELHDRFNIKIVLLSLLPYLHIKRERADLMLQLIAKIRGNGAGTEIVGTKRKKASYPESYWIELESIANLIFAQNTKRGTERESRNIRES